MTFENLLLDRDGATAVVTINRPSVLNALNSKTLEALRLAVLDIRDDSDIRVAIITGAGDKSFVAGADVGELALQRPAEGQALSLRGQHVFDLIENLGKPVIAAINGFALGGGCELAMACTLRLAADSARFGQPEINLGISPGYGGTQRLPRLVGKGVALDLLLSGRTVTADEALRVGLVNRVVPAAQLMDEARAWAADLAGKAPVAARYIMEAVNRGLDIPLDRAQFLEATLFGLVASTEDMREGTSAFLEKRTPVFKGR
ncbi:MAG: enoyl-CoA hydratase-related protein [Vicinamibacterales bacterium]